MLVRLQRLLRLPIGDQWLLVQTFVLLGVTRFLIRTLTFRRLERFLGARMAESSQELSVAHLKRARKVGWAIRTVSERTPWVSNCFPQALTAKLLLRRRDIDSTLYLGAAFAEHKQELTAHAWLRCGPAYLTGGDGREKFGAVASYS